MAGGIGWRSRAAPSGRSERTSAPRWVNSGWCKAVNAGATMQRLRSRMPVGPPRRQRFVVHRGTAGSAASTPGVYFRGTGGRYSPWRKEPDRRSEPIPRVASPRFCPRPRGEERVAVRSSARCPDEHSHPGSGEMGARPEAQVESLQMRRRTFGALSGLVVAVVAIVVITQVFTTGGTPSQTQGSTSTAPKTAQTTPGGDQNNEAQQQHSSKWAAGDPDSAAAKPGGADSAATRPGEGPVGGLEAYLAAQRTYPATVIPPAIAATAETTFEKIAKKDARRVIPRPRATNGSYSGRRRMRPSRASHPSPGRRTARRAG